jgi:hypothetical protein
VGGQKEVLLLVWRIHLKNNLTGAHKCMHHADMVVNCWMCIQWSEELIDTAVNWHSLPRAAYAHSVCTAGQHGGLYDMVTKGARVTQVKKVYREFKMKQVCLACKAGLERPSPYFTLQQERTGGTIRPRPIGESVLGC